MRKLFYIFALAAFCVSCSVAQASTFVSISVVYLSGSGDDLYALTANGDVYRQSPNSGAWNELGSLGGGNFVAMTIYHNSGGMERIYGLTPNGDVFRRDVGEQYAWPVGNIFAGNTPGQAIAITLSGQNNEGKYLYATSNDGCVFQCDEGNSSWSEVGCVLGSPTSTNATSWGSLKTLYR